MLINFILFSVGFSSSVPRALFLSCLICTNFGPFKLMIEFLENRSSISKGSKTLGQLGIQAS